VIYICRGTPGNAARGEHPLLASCTAVFWRMPYGRDHIAPIAVDLADRGFAVWNLEYRRIGTAGGGWPGTLQDVGAGIDHLATAGGRR